MIKISYKNKIKTIIHQNKKIYKKKTNFFVTNQKNSIIINTDTQENTEMRRKTTVIQNGTNTMNNMNQTTEKIGTTIIMEGKMDIQKKMINIGTTDNTGTNMDIHLEEKITGIMETNQIIEISGTTTKDSKHGMIQSTQPDQNTDQSNDDHRQPINTNNLNLNQFNLEESINLSQNINNNPKNLSQNNFKIFN